MSTSKSIKFEISANNRLTDSKPAIGIQRGRLINWKSTVPLRRELFIRRCISWLCSRTYFCFELSGTDRRDDESQIFGSCVCGAHGAVGTSREIVLENGYSIAELVVEFVAEVTGTRNSDTRGVLELLEYYFYSSEWSIQSPFSV